MNTNLMNTGESTRTRGIALAAVAAGVSGVAVFLNGYGVRAAPDPTVYTTAKNLVAAVVLAVIAVPAVAALVTRRAPAKPAGTGRPRMLGLLAIGVVGGSVPFVLFFEGLARASSTHAAFLHKTLVVWVALLAVALLREVIRPIHVAAIALLVTGQVALDGGLAGFEFGAGEALILGATLLWAVEVILVKRLLGDVRPATLSAARMAIGSVLLLAWLGVTGRLATLAGLDAVVWGWALLTGCILAGYVATWYAALALAPAVDVTAVLVLAAPVTAGIAAVVNGQLPGVTATVGGLLIVGGAAVIAASRRPVRALVTP